MSFFWDQVHRRKVFYVLRNTHPMCVFRYLGIYFTIAHGTYFQMSSKPMCKISWSQENELAWGYNINKIASIPSNGRKMQKHQWPQFLKFIFQNIFLNVIVLQIKICPNFSTLGRPSAISGLAPEVPYCLFAVIMPTPSFLLLAVTLIFSCFQRRWIVFDKGVMCAGGNLREILGSK